MSEFGIQVRERLARARLLLASARQDGDEYGVLTYTGEVAELERLAAAHGVAVAAGEPAPGGGPDEGSDDDMAEG
ncbi:hypothetical protein ACQEU6_07275 [Spirillospora sp. CA-108201]